MQHDSPYARPDLYDLLAPPFPAMEQFYREAALGCDGPVLDLACGSGRFSIPLALAGKQVVGGDLSTEMLAQARINAAGAGVHAEFVNLDVRDFELGRKFDLIFVAANSLLHLHTIDEFRRCFGAVARHLTSEGRFVFDVFAPSVAILGRTPDERHPVDVVTHPALGRVTVEETTRYDAMSQVSDIIWFWSTAQKRDFWVTRLRLRQVFQQELPLLLEAGGLQLLERFGDFDRGAFSPQSFRQVCIARAAH